MEKLGVGFALGKTRDMSFECVVDFLGCLLVAALTSGNCRVVGFDFDFDFDFDQTGVKLTECPDAEDVEAVVETATIVVSKHLQFQYSARRVQGMVG